MTNILLSEPNFDAEWAYPYLREILKKDMRVLVIPISSADEGWSSDVEEWEHRYHKGNRHYEKIVQPFENYLIPEDHISFLNYFEETGESAEKKILEADVVYLLGDNPDEMMMVIQELGIHKAILEFDGIFMASGAGANIVMDEFDSTYEWEDRSQNGLGLLRGFALEQSYVEDEAHLARLLHDLEQKGKNVFAFPKNGGLLIEDGRYRLLGEAFTVNDNDLDAVYQAYEDAKSRQDYYGDNGDW